MNEEISGPLDRLKLPEYIGAIYDDGLRIVQPSVNDTYDLVLISLLCRDTPQSYVIHVRQGASTMARISLKRLRLNRPQVDREKIDAMTEADIRRHTVEDGCDPDAEPTGYVLAAPADRNPEEPRRHAATLRRCPRCSGHDLSELGAGTEAA